MSKAINWPKEYEEELHNEEAEASKVAFRLGSLYHDKNYYNIGDIVHVRATNEIVRYALINEETYLTTIGELSDNVMQKFRKNLDSHAKIIDFLSKNYNQPVSLNTQITVIPYANKEIYEE